MTATQREQDEGTLVTRENIRFSKWADQWLAGHTGKASTVLDYGFTIAYAKRAFANRKIRDIQPGDIQKFLEVIRGANKERSRKVTDATLRKHLRGLRACFEDARVEGYVGRNVVPLLPKSQRPRVVERRPTYFTDAELAKLWLVLPTEPPQRAAKTYVFKMLVTTGMRVGELLALTWADVDFLGGELHVSKTYTEKGHIGTTTTKSGESRTVDLTPAARTVLEAWYALVSHERGYSTKGTALVFPDRNGEPLSGPNLLRRLYIRP
jgi:integrase